MDNKTHFTYKSYQLASKKWQPQIIITASVGSDILEKPMLVGEAVFDTENEANEYAEQYTIQYKEDLLEKAKTDQKVVSSLLKSQRNYKLDSAYVGC